MSDILIWQKKMYVNIEALVKNFYSAKPFQNMYFGIELSDDQNIFEI